MSDGLKKHIYLVGNEETGILAYSYSKEVAEIYCNERGKSYFVTKAKITDKLMEHLPMELEIMESAVTSEQPLLCTEDEEQWLIEALNGFSMEYVHHIDYFIDCVKYLKFTDNEKEYVNEFITYLKALREYLSSSHDEDVGYIAEGYPSEGYYDSPIVDSYKMTRFLINRYYGIKNKN